MLSHCIGALGETYSTLTSGGSEGSSEQEGYIAILAADDCPVAAAPYLTISISASNSIQRQLATLRLDPGEMLLPAMTLADWFSQRIQQVFVHLKVDQRILHAAKIQTPIIISFHVHAHTHVAHVAHVAHV